MTGRRYKMLNIERKIATDNKKNATCSGKSRRFALGSKALEYIPGLKESCRADFKAIFFWPSMVSSKVPSLEDHDHVYFYSVCVHYSKHYHINIENQPLKKFYCIKVLRSTIIEVIIF